MELTGLPSTNLIQVPCICADTARSRRGLGVGIVLARLFLEEAHRVAHFSPGVQARPLKAGKPALILEAQNPLRTAPGKPYQPISSPFFRAYSGSGLSILLARSQRTPSLASVARMVSPLTRLSVIPSSKLTSAAIARVQSVPLAEVPRTVAGYLVVPRSHSRRRRRGPPWDARSRA